MTSFSYVLLGFVVATGDIARCTFQSCLRAAILLPESVTAGQWLASAACTFGDWPAWRRQSSLAGRLRPVRLPYIIP
jgi:hypothetical protein